MHSWKDTIWKVFKKQSKSCTGSLGTGSDTDRTRFLVNVRSWNSNFSHRNRFPYWYNPVPGTKSRDMFFWEMLEPGSLLGRNRFLKVYFQKYILKDISNKVFLILKLWNMYMLMNAHCEHLYSRFKELFIPFWHLMISSIILQ